MAQFTGPNKGRNVVRASLTPEAKRALDALVREYDMTLQGLLGRILQWFIEQDRMVQLTALGLLPRDQVRPIVSLLFEQQLQQMDDADALEMVERLAAATRAEQQRRAAT
ncbi:MAG: hypothetical protein ACE5E6_12295 [Phycisphaerae bacterium]